MKDSSVDIRSKSALFFLVILLSMIFNSPLFLSGLLVCALLIGRSCSVDMKKVAAIILPLLPIFILLGLCAGFFSVAEFTDPANRDALFCLGDSLCASRGGLLLSYIFEIEFLQHFGNHVFKVVLLHGFLLNAGM